MGCKSKKDNKLFELIRQEIYNLFDSRMLWRMQKPSVRHTAGQKTREVIRLHEDWPNLLFTSRGQS